MKALTILVIAISLSACSFSKGNIIEPLCLPDQEMREDLSLDEQWYILQYDEDGALLLKIGTNDLTLKSHIKTIKRITEAHNEQFKAKCDP